MSRPKLATYVHVADERQAMHVFGPDDEVPAWAAAKIVNPNAWEGGKVPSGVESPEDEAARLRARLAELDAQAAAGDTGEQRSDGPPPRGGAGSGRDVWAAYAEANGVTVTDDMRSRDDIIAALDAAGVPTE